MAGVPRTPQKCLTCGETDPALFREHLNTRNGKRYRVKTICQKCYNEKHRAFAAKYQAPHRDRYLTQRYGLSASSYEELLLSQGGVCAICKYPEERDSLNRKWPVDHDHETGRVRGILCPNCNRALGLVRDDVEVLQQMIEYLSLED